MQWKDFFIRQTLNRFLPISTRNIFFLWLIWHHAFVTLLILFLKNSCLVYLCSLLSLYLSCSKEFQPFPSSLSLKTLLHEIFYTTITFLVLGIKLVTLCLPGRHLWCWVKSPAHTTIILIIICIIIPEACLIFQDIQVDITNKILLHRYFKSEMTAELPSTQCTATKLLYCVFVTLHPLTIILVI